MNVSGSLIVKYIALAGKETTVSVIVPPQNLMSSTYLLLLVTLAYLSFNTLVSICLSVLVYSCYTFLNKKGYVYVKEKRAVVLVKRNCPIVKLIK
jgi:hypothetical protein